LEAEVILMRLPSGAWFLATLALGAIAFAETTSESVSVPGRDRPAARSDGSLSFDPLQCPYAERVRAALRPDETAWNMFGQQGFAVLPDAENTFGDAYYRIYSRDLPVLVTSDSILHAVHCSLDRSLAELEEGTLAPMIRDILAACHDELGRRGVRPGDPWLENYRDLDLYLTVARDLLEGAPGGGRVVASHLGQDATASRILQGVASLHLQQPLRGERTALFGGTRPIDFSQFQVRGHYTKTRWLGNYFRTLLWLGRADCGWCVAPPHSNSGIHSDSDRELRDAVLLVDLLRASKRLEQLAAMDQAVELFLGRSDNLRPMELHKLLGAAKITSLADTSDPSALARLRDAIGRQGAAAQRICSQVIYGAKPGEDETPPPALVQMLGQRFAIDSYALDRVVYDAVPPRPGIPWRMQPTGLDAMAALGNPEAWRLLADERAKYQYDPQLAAARKFTVGYLADRARQSSLYDLRLAALQTLQADLSKEEFFPQVMRGEAWRLKQLQTQLASWAELRHDGILYVKQSYTKNEECSYPAGYVEPYPEFYARMRQLAQRAAEGLTRLAATDPALDPSTEPPRRFWQAAAVTMEKLETLACKELRGEAFTADEMQFIKETISLHKEPDGCDSYVTRSCSGWYCNLFYPTTMAAVTSQPTVADVHTDPRDGHVLEVGVGRVRLALAAIDNGSDRAVYVGPVYTYYEFTQPADQRLTDERFAALLSSSPAPQPPEWTKAFLAGQQGRFQRSARPPAPSLDTVPGSPPRRAAGASEGDRRPWESLQFPPPRKID
jgi:hypothetical protein